VVTPAGPACDHCHTLFEGQSCYGGFFCCQMKYCSIACLDAAEEERKRRFWAEQYFIKKHGRRYWKVVDGNDDLVCVTLYKKGAEEVIRRITGRKPPPFRPETGLSATKVQCATEARPIDPMYRRKRQAKAA
jgi:hypothetical protein